MTTHRIKLTDLDEEFIQKLQDKFSESDAELVIQVHERPTGEILTDEVFWELIAVLDWEKEEDNAIVEPLVDQLSSLSVGMIYQFLDKFSEKLYQLDTIEHAKNTGK
ncbi:MAG: DUF4240 domain-containing protein [Bacteroidota bacterium]